jgi:hypothetical protein
MSRYNHGGLTQRLAWSAVVFMGCLGGAVFILALIDTFAGH